MIQKWVAMALRFPTLVLISALAILIGGVSAYRQLNIEAYPNPIPPMIEVIIQPEGWSAEDVETYITLPTETSLLGMPALEHIRSQSLFGLSDIKCYFSWNTSYEVARQEVLNRLQFVSLPAGMQPKLSPWNPVGEIFRYTLEGSQYSKAELKTAQDWILERQFRQVPGVIDVTSFGGETKQYQVNVDPYRLRGQGLTLDQLTTAVRNANQNVGGQRLSLGEQSYNIRGVGLLQSTQDIEAAVVLAPKGTPIRVKDVADVEVGAAPRLGRIGQDERSDVVEGIVLMQYGGETQKTLDGIYQRLAFINKNHLLPKDMEIKPYYDRGDLISLTTHTVIENLVVGILLVSAILFLFLGNGRAAFITALTIPISLFIAFAGLLFSHTSANLLSIGAIDFGIVVDSSVIMMETIFRRLGSQAEGTLKERILAAAKEVAVPMSFSTLIIGASFLPLLTLRGVSGVIFSPMARTYAFAISGAVILALTLVPVLSYFLLSGKIKEKETVVLRGLHHIYRPIFNRVVTYPKTALLVALLPIAVCLLLFPLLGREFMPKLEEGNLWIRATLPMSISLEESAKYADRIRAIVRGCADADCKAETRRHPEVISTTSQAGRPDDGTDVSGFSNIELFAPLKPFNQWQHGKTKQQLINELSYELNQAFPGTVFNFSQMISDNVEEALAGVKGENSIKVFGPEISVNESVAHGIINKISKIPGIEDLGMLSSLGQPTLRITPDRAACSRYGLNVGDVTSIIQAAIGGQTVTEVYEDEERFDLVVRYLPQYRQSIRAIREITLVTPDLGQVPLGQIAKIELVNGAGTIFREDGQRYIPIKFSVRGRDLAGTVQEAQRKIEEKVPLLGTRLEWSGELNELKDAEARLRWMIPLTLVLIGFLTYSAVKTGRDTLVVLLNIPMACAGGLVALFISGVHFSVSAAMGFVSIFGIAIQDAILIVTYFQRLHLQEGVPVEEAAKEAAEKRFRPGLMTTLVATLGLLPSALSHGIGSQAQKPLAIVVIGGALSLAFLMRILQPALLTLVYRSRKKNEP